MDNDGRSRKQDEAERKRQRLAEALRRNLRRRKQGLKKPPADKSSNGAGTSRG